MMKNHALKRVMKEMAVLEADPCYSRYKAKLLDYDPFSPSNISVEVTIAYPDIESDAWPNEVTMTFLFPPSYPFDGPVIKMDDPQFGHMKPFHEGWCFQFYKNYPSYSLAQFILELDVIISEWFSC